MYLSYSTVAISLLLVAHRWNCQCVIPVSLIATVPTFLEKSVFYKYLYFPLATDTVCRLLFGIQNFLGDTFGGTVYPEDILCGGTQYHRILCMEIQKTRDAKYPMTPVDDKVSKSRG